MRTQVIEEAGYFVAMLGLSLSYNQEVARMPTVAERLRFMGNGHNKYLESIAVWLDVEAPRYWWSQADTYRLSTKQSESTMHTILREPLTQENFEGGDIPEDYLAHLNELIMAKEFATLKKRLPESFLQRRIWMVNYRVLQNIITQRNTHKLPEWQSFIDSVLQGVTYPELLIDESKEV